MNFEELKVYRYTRAREESTDVLREEVQLQINHEKKTNGNIFGHPVTNATEKKYQMSISI
jgi:hypothetical protein